MKCWKHKTGALWKKNSEWLLWNRLAWGWMVYVYYIGEKYIYIYQTHPIVYNNIIQVYMYIERESVRVFVHTALRSHVGEPAKKKKNQKFQGQAGFLEIIRRLRCRAVVISSHFIVRRRRRVAVRRTRYTNTTRSGNLPAGWV